MKFVDLTDKTFGHLTVIAYEGVGFRKGGSRGNVSVNLWRVRCDCGHEKIIHANRVSRSKTCGVRGQCPFAKHARFTKTNPTEAGIFRVHSKYRRKAEVAGREFSLSLAEVADIISKDCFYCGLPPSNTARPDTKWLSRLKYSGIDRIRNEQGYIVGNVLPCCRRCNWMKGTLTQEEFLAHISLLYRRLVEKI